jgi:hypothetical protein
MNKRRECRNQDNKTETVKDRRTRGISLTGAGLRVQFWILMQCNSRTRDHKIILFLK